MRSSWLRLTTRRLFARCPGKTCRQRRQGPANGEGTEPTDDLHGDESLTRVFESLRTYKVTTHFNGQSTVGLDGDRATGERAAAWPITSFGRGASARSWSRRCATWIRSAGRAGPGGSPNVTCT